METSYFWTYSLSGFIAAIGVLWLTSSFPEVLSPSLRKIKKATLWEYFFFSFSLILIFLAVGNRYLAWPDNVATCFFFLLMMACVWTDIKKGIIPNRLIAAGVVGWLFFSILYGFQGVEVVMAAFSLSFVMLLVNLTSIWISEKEAFGMGDVKLLFVIGLFTGWEGFWLLYLSIFIGAITAVTGIVFLRFERETRLPFAPFIAAGCILGIFVLPWVYIMGWLNAI